MADSENSSKHTCQAACYRRQAAGDHPEKALDSETAIWVGRHSDAGLADFVCWFVFVLMKTRSAERRCRCRRKTKLVAQKDLQQMFAEDDVNTA